MSDNSEQFVYSTEGVCPPEIHFQVREGLLQGVRFVGGGCPGNAQLVGRLLEGQPLEKALSLLGGIVCRNDTSCPDQFAKALNAIQAGLLTPARPVRIMTDPTGHNRIGIMGEVAGDADAFETLIETMQREDVEAIYCLGNLTGDSVRNRDVLTISKRQKMFALQGELDHRYAQGGEPKGYPPLSPKYRDQLLTAPHLLSFTFAGKGGVGFFGKFVQALPGYSDFQPFSLEVNMVCNLTDFFKDERVFPALEAMIPQFKAQIVLFSETQRWGHWRLGGVDFIGIGPASGDDGLAFGLLEALDGKVAFRTVRLS